MGGEPTLFNAVKSATEDFRDERRFPKEVSRRVVIITGGDYCDPMTPNNIHAALERRKIIPDFYLIGMDLPPDRRERIKWVAGAAGGWFHHVTTEAELNRILKRIIEIEPVINSIKRLTEILNAVTGHINDMHYAVRDQRYEEAEDALARRREQVVRRHMES